MTVHIDIMDSYNKRLYGDPFFELSNFYMPKNFKKFFKWCAFFFSTNALVGPPIVSLSRYPITAPTYASIKNSKSSIDGDRDDILCKFYKSLFEDVLDIKAQMVNISIEYNVYGNCFVILNVPFKRILACPKCKSEHSVDSVKYKYMWKKVKFKGKCPKCKKEVTFKAIDNVLSYPTGMRIQRLYPGDIDIKENRITGDTIYYYTIPAKDRSLIKRGDKFMIDTTPLLYLESIAKGAPIKFNDGQVFHFKRPNITGQNQQWGVPLVLPAMKKLFYMQILNKAQEAIAIQRIVPLTMIFPVGGNGESPYEVANLGVWRNNVEKAINNWKKDPNHIGIFPFPVGTQPLFSEGKSLLVTPEIRQAANEVIAGMGIPQELVFGGLQWTGSSITLRMMENQFLNHRGEMIDFLEFLVRKISSILKIPKIRPGLQKFKMIDDIQQKQMLFQLNADNKLSTQELMASMGMDMKEEIEKIKNEISLMGEVNKIGRMAETKVQGEIMIEQSKYQARAQAAGEFALNKEKKRLMNSMDIEAEQWAYDLESLPPSQRMQIMNRIRSDMPGMYEMINNARGAMMQSQEQGQEQEQEQGQGQFQQPEEEQQDTEEASDGNTMATRPVRPSVGPSGPRSPELKPTDIQDQGVKAPRSLENQ